MPTDGGQRGKGEVVMTNGSAGASRYAGKVAVVTGGASGIGEAICRRLLAEGASVVAGDINEERLRLLGAELGDSFHGVPANVSVEADVERLIAETGRFGLLDCAFNVAGLGRGAPIIDQSEDDWNFVLGVCLNGVFLAMKHEGRLMTDSGHGGAILNVSSLNSEVPMFGGSSYCTAKAGVAMLTKCGALEMAEAGIRVNAVSPGLTDTPLTAMSREIPGILEAYMERIPFKRAGTPEEIAAAALYLASGDAGYVSGVNLFVDGAWATTGYPDLRPYHAAAAAAAGIQQ
jgi:NAD(P)-dependent dehydrogenase (short-subunit alcohol dehydrogenase family)